MVLSGSQACALTPCCKPPDEPFGGGNTPYGTARHAATGVQRQPIKTFNPIIPETVETSLLMTAVTPSDNETCTHKICPAMSAFGQTGHESIRPKDRV
jgi:hypothetical protein